MEKESKAGAATADGRSSGEVARHIARAAARLFADRGYDATSVREIVEAAGVTKPTLYYHFGSKQGLAEALLTRPMTEFVESLRALIRDEPDPIRLLRRSIAAHLAFSGEEADRFRFFFAICFGPNSTSLQEEIHRFGEAMTRELVNCVRRLADSGVIDPTRVEACSQACRGMIMISTLDALFCKRELDPSLADRFVGDLLRGFGKPGLSFDGERGQDS